LKGVVKKLKAKKQMKKIGSLTAEETIKLLDKLSSSNSLKRNFANLCVGLTVHLMKLYADTFAHKEDVKGRTSNVETRAIIKKYIAREGKREDQKMIEIK